MKLVMILIAVAAMGGCNTPAPNHPNIQYAGSGYVMVTDWTPRMFVLQQDDGLIVTLKACSGEMPVWPKEHILIHSHRVWSEILERYEGCDIFDWVQRLGADAR